MQRTISHSSETKRGEHGHRVPATINTYKRCARAFLVVAALAVGAAGESLADEPQRHVTAKTEIQARIDQQVDAVAADRQAIQTLLQRADIRRVAGAAGLDIERASVAAQVLSGSSLESLASQARAVDADLVGAGSGTIVISTTTVIIILLLIIILAN